MDHEMRHLINLFTLYKYSIEHNKKTTGYPILPIVYFPSFEYNS